MISLRFFKNFWIYGWLPPTMQLLEIPHAPFARSDAPADGSLYEMNQYGMSSNYIRGLPPKS